MIPSLKNAQVPYLKGPKSFSSSLWNSQVPCLKGRIPSLGNTQASYPKGQIPRFENIPKLPIQVMPESPVWNSASQALEIKGWIPKSHIWNAKPTPKKHPTWSTAHSKFTAFPPKLTVVSKEMSNLHRLVLVLYYSNWLTKVIKLGLSIHRTV